MYNFICIDMNSLFRVVSLINGRMVDVYKLKQESLEEQLQKAPVSPIHNSPTRAHVLFSDIAER